MVNDLPETLRELVAAEGWATEGSLLDTRIPVEVAKHWDPDSRGIHLQTPLPLSEEVAENRLFWDEFGALATIKVGDYAVIGDFGLGSDSPIVVALKNKPAHVMRLAWSMSEVGQDSANRWEVIADDFDSFLGVIFPNGPTKKGDYDTG